MVARRFELVTANAFSVPSLMNCWTPFTLSNMTSTRPLTTSDSAMDPLRYGTWVISSAPTAFIISPVRWLPDPTPVPEAKFTLPGFCLIYAVNSEMEFGLKFLPATRM
ncbi:hypothetical protein D3C71_1529830 [compost metagenome]